MQGLKREVLPPLYQTLKEYVETKYRPFVFPDYSERWRETATGHLGLILEGLGHLPIYELKLDVLEPWWAATKASRGARTANMCLYRLRHLLKHAVVRGALATNEATLLRPVRENGHRIKWLEDAQWHALVKVAPKNIRPYILAARYTAGRLGELRRLQERDIDLVAGTVRLNRTKVGDSHTIPLVKPFQTLIEAAWENAPERHILPVFAMRESITTGFRRACARMTPPLYDFTFHDLRHDAAVWLLRVSHNLKLVQQVLGHKTLATTQRYAFALQDEMREAMERIALLG